MLVGLFACGIIRDYSTIQSTSIRPTRKYFVENTWKLALDSYFLNHVFWGRFMDDVISVWNYGESERKGYLEHLNTYDRNLQFTLETETKGKIPFFRCIDNKQYLNKLDFTVYRKPTHNNRYLHFKSNHPPQVKRGVVIYLEDRVLNICSEPYTKKELNFITDILFGNWYQISLINTVIAQKLKMHSSKALNPTPVNDSNKPTSTICLPYIPIIILYSDTPISEYRISLYSDTSKVKKSLFKKQFTCCIHK